jgi:hypothetical protein
MGRLTSSAVLIYSTSRHYSWGAPGSPGRILLRSASLAALGDKDIVLCCCLMGRSEFIQAGSCRVAAAVASIAEPSLRLLRGAGSTLLTSHDSRPAHLWPPLSTRTASMHDAGVLTCVNGVHLVRGMINYCAYDTLRTTFIRRAIEERSGFVGLRVVHARLHRTMEQSHRTRIV